MRGVCPFCNSFTTVCLCVCVTVCTNDATGTVWATPGLEQLLSREHRLPLSGLKLKTKSADNDPASHCIREAGCHWQDQVTGYEQALPSTSICYTLLYICLALACSGLCWTSRDYEWWRSPPTPTGTATAPPTTQATGQNPPSCLVLDPLQFQRYHQIQSKQGIQEKYHKAKNQKH